MNAHLKTLVLGASTNPQRYAFRAITLLRQHAIPTVGYGLRAGQVADVEILTDWQAVIAEGPYHTVTLYLNPKRQAEYRERIEALKPKRVLFNPGTENPPFEAELLNQEITPEQACTLVLLNTNQFA